jgi:hypothetical protein
LLAGASALLAYFGALAAGVLVVTGAYEHEISCRLTDFSTGHHEPEVLGLDVLAPLLEAVGHRHSKARRMAALAFFDAGAHFR